MWCLLLSAPPQSKTFYTAPTHLPLQYPPLPLFPPIKISDLAIHSGCAKKIQGYKLQLTVKFGPHHIYPFLIGCWLTDIIYGSFSKLQRNMHKHKQPSTATLCIMVWLRLGNRIVSTDKNIPRACKVSLCARKTVSLSFCKTWISGF